MLRSIYRKTHAAVLRGLAALGLNVARTADFYSPLPVLADLEKTRELWDRPSELVGIRYDLGAMKELLARLAAAHASEFLELPSHEEIKKLRYGPGFPVLDAMLTFFMMRDLEPRRYVEIGSGLSTYYAWLAAERNRSDGASCEITCVDPFPTGRLWSLPHVSAIESRVEAVDLDLFRGLSAGDVLFIDSTHVLKIGGDVAFLFLEVIPRLAPGVAIHVHDIHFPYNVPYPAEQYIFATKWPSYWTEAMLLQAFLAFNDQFEILLSAPLLRHHDEPFLAARLPGYRPLDPADTDTHAGSLWYRRRPA